LGKVTVHKSIVMAVWYRYVSDPLQVHGQFTNP